MEKENKKKGIRGLFNLFDLALIILAAALAALLIFGGGGDGGGIAAPGGAQTAVRYTLELTGLENGSASLIKPGDPVVDRIKKYSIGTAESVEITPTVKSVTDEASGKVVRTEVPGQETALVTVTAMADETDRDITVDGGFIVKVGTSVNVKTPGVSAAGFIVAVERGDGQ